MSQLVPELVTAERRGLLTYLGTHSGGYEVRLGGRQAPSTVLTATRAAQLLDRLQTLHDARGRGEIAAYTVDASGWTFSVLAPGGFTVEARPAGDLHPWLAGWRAGYAGQRERGPGDARPDVGEALRAAVLDPPLQLQLRLQLRAAGEGLQLSLAEMARRTGRTEKTVSMALRPGGNRITLATADDLLRALGGWWQVRPRVTGAGRRAPLAEQCRRRLRQLMTAQGVRVIDMARALNHKESTITAALAGDPQLSVRLAEAMMRHLGHRWGVSAMLPAGHGAGRAAGNPAIWADLGQLVSAREQGWLRYLAPPGLQLVHTAGAPLVDVAGHLHTVPRESITAWVIGLADWHRAMQERA